MKKVIISLVLFTLTMVANAQVAPKIHNYSPTYIQYGNGRTADIDDYRWKTNNNLWLKSYQDGRIELMISSDLPMEFYSLGPIDIMDQDLTSFRRNYFLKYISKNDKEYTYWSEAYNMNIYISTDAKVISYKRNGDDFTVFNNFNDLSKHNNNVRYDQPSPFRK